MEIASKFLNAAGGFWDSLDDQERRLLVVYGAYLLSVALVGWHRSSRERMKRDLIEEIRGERV